MNMPEMHITKIHMTFWVELFLRDCEIYKSLQPHEYSNDTLVCDFLRKHIFATLIADANEAMEEYKPKNDKELPSSQYIMCRTILRAATSLAKSVKQYKQLDDMVHVDFSIFTPLYKGKPVNQEAIHAWIISHVLFPMKTVAEGLAESNKLHGGVYLQFAREVDKMAKTGTSFADQFSYFTFETIKRNEQI
jgi:hypothetical protein